MYLWNLSERSHYPCPCDRNIGIDRIWKMGEKVCYKQSLLEA